MASESDDGGEEGGRPADSEVRKSGFGQADHGKSDHGKSDHGKSDHGKSDHGKSDHGKSDHGKSDHGKSDHGKSDHGKSDHGKSDHGKSDHGKSDHGKSDHGKSDHGKSDHGKSDHGKSDHGKSGYGKPSYGKPGFGRPAFGKPGFGKTAYGKPGFGKPAYGQRPRPAGPQPAHEGAAVLYGFHPVVQAMGNAERKLHRLLATENGAARLVEELGTLRIEPELVRPADINRLLGADAVHQGLYLEADPLASPGLDALPADALLLALDQITDPHNVGAIVRTAAAFGVTGIVTTARHAPGATGVLAKSASGGLEHVPFLVVRNLAEALITLGEQGFTRIGLDSDAETGLDTLTPTRPAVIVLGAEGKGLRERTRACCDVLAKIPFTGEIRSLNVSNAAAIALYALGR